MDRTGNASRELGGDLVINLRERKYTRCSLREGHNNPCGLRAIFLMTLYWPSQIAFRVDSEATVATIVTCGAHQKPFGSPRAFQALLHQID